MIIDATFWVAISFAIFCGIIIYLKLPQKINQALDLKISEIKNELNNAEKLRDEAKNVLVNYENKIVKAQEESNNIINSTHKKNEENIILETEKFHKLMENRKKALEFKIAQMKNDALKSIKNTSVKISIEAVENIIKKSIDKSKLDSLYSKNLEEAKNALKKTKV